METLLNVGYSTIMLGLGILISVASIVALSCFIGFIWSSADAALRARYKRGLMMEIEAQGNSTWHAQYAEQYEKNIVLQNENNKLRKKLYPGKC